MTKPSDATAYRDPEVQCSAEEQRANGVDYCILERGHRGAHRCHFGHMWKRRP